MRRLISFFFPLVILLFVSGNIVLADNLKLETEVNHIANVVEKLKEKVTLFFKFSKVEKFNYNKYLVEKRLVELKYVIDTKQGNLIEETSSRYSTYLGNFTDFVVKSKLSSKKEELLKMYEEHEKILEALNNFEYESGFWLLLMHDINSTKIFSTQAKDKL